MQMHQSGRAAARAGVGGAQYLRAQYRAAIGSFVGGLFYARDLLHELGLVAMVFVALAVTLVFASGPRQTLAG
jgi:predicted MFS family arabinose efflux permease